MLVDAALRRGDEGGARRRARARRERHAAHHVRHREVAQARLEGARRRAVHGRVADPREGHRQGAVQLAGEAARGDQGEEVRRRTRTRRSAASCRSTSSRISTSPAATRARRRSTTRASSSGSRSTATRKASPRDVVFNGATTRTIHVDARYMIWTMDALDGADHLIKEMGLTPKMSERRRPRRCASRAREPDVARIGIAGEPAPAEPRARRPRSCPSRRTDRRRAGRAVLDARIRRSISASGFCVACGVFSVMPLQITGTSITSRGLAPSGCGLPLVAPHAAAVLRRHRLDRASDTSWCGRCTARARRRRRARDRARAGGGSIRASGPSRGRGSPCSCSTRSASGSRRTASRCAP